MKTISIIFILLLSVGCTFLNVPKEYREHFYNAKEVANSVELMPRKTILQKTKYYVAAFNFAKSYGLSSAYNDEDISNVLGAGNNVYFVTSSDLLRSCYGAGGKLSTYTRITQFTTPDKYIGSVFSDEIVLLSKPYCRRVERNTVNKSGNFISVQTLDGKRGFIQKSSISQKIPKKITLVDKASVRESGKGSKSLTGLGTLGKWYVKGLIKALSK